MEKQYGAEKTDAIIEDAWRRYAEIVDENADEPKKDVYAYAETHLSCHRRL